MAILDQNNKLCPTDTVEFRRCSSAEYGGQEKREVEGAPIFSDCDTVKVPGRRWITLVSG